MWLLELWQRVMKTIMETIKNNEEYDISKLTEFVLQHKELLDYLDNYDKEKENLPIKQ